MRTAHASHPETFITERPVRRETLDNGLRVVVAPMAHVHSAYVGFWLRAGAQFRTIPRKYISSADDAPPLPAF